MNALELLKARKQKLEAKLAVEESATVRGRYAEVTYLLLVLEAH